MQIAKIGFAKAMKNKWVKICADKSKVERIAADIVDTDRNQALAFRDEPSADKHAKKMIDEFKKRKWINVVSKKSYKVTKGEDFAPQRVKLETMLTADMLRSGAW